MPIHPISSAAGTSTAVLVALVTIAVAVQSGGVVGADAVAGNSTEARRLQGAFKRAKSVEERSVIAADLLDLGGEGGRRLHAIARADLVERLPKYSAAFQRAAADLLGQRAPKGDPSAEIAHLRQTIRDVAARPELTKEMIQEKSDPALARLEELLVVSAGDVLAAKPDLVGQRAELLLLAEWAERAAVLLPEKEQGKLPPLPTPAAISAQLDATDELAAILAAPLAPADRQVLTANAAAARELDPEEARGVQRLNQIRILVGLSAQAIDPGLVKACRVHSEDMCARGFFAHESPVAGRETPWKRAQAAGTSAGAENIAAGTESGAGAIQMWWHSPGHHKNMLGDHKRTGLGRYERHWTQLFG
ncbi:MAG: CAP domain-containing protein [Pirellulales bacterium]